MGSLINFLELPKLNLIYIVHPHTIHSLDHAQYLFDLFSILRGKYFAVFYHVDKKQLFAILFVMIEGDVVFVVI
jgi:hypothetical protein